ncbi:glycosyltransferase family 1 protein [Oscillatoria sp. FACHB-1406]|uniref:glycosyltransferase family 4 protein n=1 Tax=Oscillatoria sp. FACHB-1406 TaxID=2692846 RepID=UPI0032207E9C
MTALTPRPSGVGLYIANLIYFFDAIQTKENFELSIAYQPGLKNWLRGKLELPNFLDAYSHRYLLPLPVRISNLLLDRAPFIFPLCFESSLNSPDIFHGTNYNVYPYKYPLKVMTIYDLTCAKYPQYINSVVKTYFKRIQRCLEWTDLVITISESSKRDIVEYLNFDPDRIWVTPLASRYSGEQPLLASLPQPQAPYNFSRPYLLFVSTLEPRKNIVAIVEAFNYLKQKYRIEQQLVLIGQKGWKYEPILDAIARSPYSHEIHHLNYLSDNDVAWFYQHADVFVYPSHYEGFGLPVLEAMTLGAPVVTANTSSLPEVAGDAALLVNPDEPLELAEAIFNVLQSSQLRQTLIEKGRERAKLFSWEKTALETLAAYRSIL